VIDDRRKAYLDAMGIELWTSRVPVEPAVRRPEQVVESHTAVPPVPEELAPPVLEEPTSDDAAPVFEQIPADAYDEPPEAEEDEDVDSVFSGVSNLDWPELAERVAACRNCALCESRTNTVFGVGDQNASLLIIGEAPGAEEDKKAEPFVGRAGQLLTAMLKAIGFARDQVYIANVLKCRPPGNRDPHVDEVAACQPYLNRQIELIQPKLILSVGGVSAKNLLSTDQSVGRLRGKVHEYLPTGTPLMVTYHPAYLLRRPEEKAKTWTDLQQVWRYLRDQGEA
jgi:DNA polymerase